MRKTFRKSHSPLVLILMLLPFVVGFDMNDSSGTYAKVSGGHGAYHLTGCHRDFDSRFNEGEIELKHTFATAAADKPDPSFLDKARPALTTVGGFADFVSQDLTVVRAVSPSTSKAGDQESARGFAGGAYVGLDWRWVGVDLGLNALLMNLGVDDAEKNKVAPMLGLRLGSAEGIYATGEVNGANPYLSGGGQVNAGLGMKFGATRAWLGAGTFFSGNAPLGMIKVDQGWGPWGVTLTAEGSGKNVPPADLGIDHEYGFSLGLIYRLSSLDGGK